MTLMAHSIGTLALGSRNGSGWSYTGSRGRGCLIYNAWSGPLLPRKGVFSRTKRDRDVSSLQMDTSILKHFYRAMVKSQILERSRLIVSLENSAFATCAVWKAVLIVACMCQDIGDKKSLAQISGFSTRVHISRRHAHFGSPKWLTIQL
jgi:hypothetical protein